MKFPSSDPLKLDVQALAEQGGSLAGAWPLAELPRLADSVLQGTPVNWRLQGELRQLPGGAPEIWLGLAAETEVALTCQRCLEPVSEHLAVDRWLRFVAGGEEAAAALDAEMEDDVLALRPRMNARELVEDELLLALPLVPRHAVCPQSLPAGADTAAPATQRPFEALASLKR
ncbi:MAG: DUF177 domain-containing protein [Proteobacteria bacterium]|nr:DUF177 domain-containing protein [Pseudomonadota bacterium]